MKFEEHEVPTDIVYAARNYVKKNFNALQEVYMVRYFIQAAKLHYVVTKK
jgi:hypothetical protein